MEHLILESREPVHRATAPVDINGSAGDDGGAGAVKGGPSRRTVVFRTNSVTPTAPDADTTPLLQKAANDGANANVSDGEEDDDDNVVVATQPLAGGASPKAQPPPTAAATQTTRASLPLAVGSYFLSAADADAVPIEDDDDDVVAGGLPGARASPPAKASATAARGKYPVTFAEAAQLPREVLHRRRVLRNRWWLYLSLHANPTLHKLRRHYQYDVTIISKDGLPSPAELAASSSAPSGSL